MISLPSCKRLLGVFPYWGKTSVLQAKLFLIFKDNWKHTGEFSNVDLKLSSLKILNTFIRKGPSNLGAF